MTRRTIHLTGLLFITSILLSLTFLTSAQDTDFSCDDAQHPIECKALVAIYNATGGENWNNTEGWLKDVDVCEWEGITCDEDGQVSDIRLVGNELIGTLPSEFGNLSNLQTLTLWNNNLTSLPPEIGNLPNLQSLDVSFNDLTSLPSEIGNLGNLQKLYVGGNDLTSLPPEIGNLINLEDLSLAYCAIACVGNYLTNLPSEIGNLGNLEKLQLEDNPLTCVPEGVAHLVDDLPVCEDEAEAQETSDTAFSCYDAQHPIECEALVAIYNATGGENWNRSDEWLETADVCLWEGITCDDDGHVSEIDLWGNNLTGVLPPEIGNLNSLQSLDVGDNALTSLPPEIGNLNSLKSLSLGRCTLACFGNNLTFLPPEIGNLINLQTLSVESNELTSLPPEIGNLSSLQHLWIGDNDLTSLPPEIGNLSNLQSLHLGANELTSLPPEIGNLNNLQRLWVGRNKLMSVPPEIDNLSNLEWLDVSSNPVTCIPNRMVHLVDELPACEVIEALTDPVRFCISAQYPVECEALVAIYDMTEGQDWRHKDDWLTDIDFCTWEGITCDDSGHVIKIDLWGNNLKGILPTKVGDLANLQRFNLSRNDLTSLPPEIGHLANLEELHLAYNDLTSLPPEIGNLKKLEILFVRGNELTSLPTEIENLNNLQWLNVRDNPLTCIPEGVAHLVEYMQLPVCEG